MANLQGAKLQDAKLQGADLQYANLEGADLRYAILVEADLQGAKYDSETDFEGSNITQGQRDSMEDEE